MKRGNKKSENLHGKTWAQSSQALLLIDVINDLEFPGGEKLVKQAGKLADSIGKLVKRARQAKVPILYINDNFRQWRSDFQKIWGHCAHKAAKGSILANTLKPGP